MSQLILPRRLREGGSIATPRRNQRGFIINPYAFATSGGGDPLFAYVTSLLHFEGTNGGTTFTDVIGSNTWAPSGTIVTSTTEKKFGTSSLFNNSSGNIDCSTALGAGIGTGEFCIEGWFYASSSGTTFRGLLDSRLNSTVGGIAVGFDTGSNIWQVYFGGSAHDASGTLPITTWTHFALERVSTTVTLYIGGASANSFTSSASNTDTALHYSAYFSGAARWSGWQDECRATVGAYRYGAPFTPPTSAFPDS